MKRVCLTVAYDGTAYHGSALQEHEPATIEAFLNRAVKAATGEDSPVIGASRTDAGVHARGAVFVFDTESSIPPDRFIYVLNHLLPDDIRIRESREVPADFHPRKRPCNKTYCYRILNSEAEDPTRRLYTWHMPRALDLSKMQAAARFLVGEHDFTSFCATASTSPDHVRTITALSVDRHGDEIIITVTGNGFLYNMVRIITGTLVQIGWGWREPEDMKTILDGRDRALAGTTAPPQGLMLMGYEYQ